MSKSKRSNLKNLKEEETFTNKTNHIMKMIAGTLRQADRYPELYSQILWCVKSLILAVEAGYVDEEFANQIYNSLKYLNDELTKESVNAEMVGAYAKLYHDFYKELKNRKEIQRHSLNNHVKNLLHDMERLDNEIYKIVNNLDNNFSYNKPLSSKLNERVHDINNAFESINKSKQTLEIPLVENLHEHGILDRDDLYQHALYEIMNACKVLIEVAKQDTVDKDTIRNIEIHIQDVHQAMQAIRPNGLSKQEMIEQPTAEDFAQAIKSYNNFVRKQSAAVIGKQLLFALKAVGAACMTAFTLGVGLGKAKQIYKHAKDEVLLNKQIKQQVSIFKPKKHQHAMQKNSRKPKGQNTR